MKLPDVSSSRPKYLADLEMSETANLSDLMENFSTIISLTVNFNYL